MGIDEQLGALSHETLHHRRSVVGAVLRNQRSDDLLGVLSRSSTVLQSDAQACVMSGDTFALVYLPTGLPPKMFRSHARIVDAETKSILRRPRPAKLRLKHVGFLSEA